MEDIDSISKLFTLKNVGYIAIGIFICKNFYTFLTGTKGERSLLTKELRMFRDLCIHGLALAYFTLLGNFKFTENKIDDPIGFKWIINKWSIIILVISILWLIILTFYIPKKFPPKYDAKKIFKFKCFCIISVMCGIYYLFVISYFFGFIVNVLNMQCIQQFGIEEHTTIRFFNVVFKDPINPKYLGAFYPLLLLISLIYWYLAKLPIIHSRVWIDPNQRVKVNLSNGQTMSNIYVLHPTFNKSLLFGDKPRYKECTRSFLISRDKIDHIEFIKGRSIFHKYVPEINSSKKSPRKIFSAKIRAAKQPIKRYSNRLIPFTKTDKDRPL